MEKTRQTLLATVAQKRAVAAEAGQTLKIQIPMSDKKQLIIDLAVTPAKLKQALDEAATKYSIWPSTQREVRTRALPAHQISDKNAFQVLYDFLEGEGAMGLQSYKYLVLSNLFNVTVPTEQDAEALVKACSGFIKSYLDTERQRSEKEVLDLIAKRKEEARMKEPPGGRRVRAPIAVPQEPLPPSSEVPAASVTSTEKAEGLPEEIPQASQAPVAEKRVTPPVESQARVSTPGPQEQVQESLPPRREVPAAPVTSTEKTVGLPEVVTQASQAPVAAEQVPPPAQSPVEMPEQVSPKTKRPSSGSQTQFFAPQTPPARDLTNLVVGDLKLAFGNELKNYVPVVMKQDNCVAAFCNFVNGNADERFKAEIVAKIFCPGKEMTGGQKLELLQQVKTNVQEKLTSDSELAGQVETLKQRAVIGAIPGGFGVPKK